MSKNAFKRVRKAIGLPVNREPLPAYAWPGGYPLIYLFADGGVLCPECANENISLIAEETKHGYRPRNVPQYGGWTLDGVEPHYEETDGPTHCDHCGRYIESAYGPVEAS